MVSKFPFQQEKTQEKLIRTFSPETDPEELIWHRDLKNRRVKVLEPGGWQYQTENNLPIKLTENQEIYIAKGDWHRVLKGNSKLVVEIIEID